MSLTSEQIKFKKGKLSELSETKDVGTLYFAYDDLSLTPATIYLDYDEDTRIKIGGIGYDYSSQAEEGYSNYEGSIIFNDYRKRDETDTQNPVGNIAKGQYASAFGQGTSANGYCSLSSGCRTIAKGQFSSAFGSHTAAEGKYSMSFGCYTESSGENALAGGYYTFAKGKNSFSFGDGNNVTDNSGIFCPKRTYDSTSGEYLYTITNVDPNYSMDVINPETGDLTPLGSLRVGDFVDLKDEDGEIIAREQILKKMYTPPTDSTPAKWQVVFASKYIEYKLEYLLQVKGGSYGDYSTSIGHHCKSFGEGSFAGGINQVSSGKGSFGFGIIDLLAIETERAQKEPEYNRIQEQIEYYKDLMESATPASQALYQSYIASLVVERTLYKNFVDIYKQIKTYPGIGDYSATFGFQTFAPGKSSFVVGQLNQANENYSFIAGKGNISKYSNMAIFGSYSDCPYDDVDGALIKIPCTLFVDDLELLSKPTSGVSTYEFKDKPQFLIGNGDNIKGASNSFEIFSTGIVRASSGFEVMDKGYVGYISDMDTLCHETVEEKEFKIVAMTGPLILDGVDTISPPKAKNGLLNLGSTDSYWKSAYLLDNIYATNFLFNDDTGGLKSGYHYGGSHYGLQLETNGTVISLKTANGGYIIPDTSTRTNLGGSGAGARWNYLFIRGLNISPPGEKDGDTALAGGVYSDFLPNGTRNLGNSDYRWNSVYTKVINASGTATISGNITGTGTENKIHHLYPYNKGTSMLGNSDNKWKAVWCAQSSINSGSDIRIKDVQENFILEKLLKMYEQLTPIAYKFKNIYETDNHDRIHVGLSSQEVELKMLENGLSRLDFAGLLVDPVYRQDENGENTAEQIDEQYGLRYGEFHGLHMLKNHQQDARLAELEAKNKELENTISNLKTQMELLRLAVGG